MEPRGHGDDASSSSGQEDGNAEWKAAIDSVAASSAYVSSLMNGVSANSTHKHANNLHGDGDGDHDGDADRYYRRKAPRPKPYQLKALKLLDDMLEKTLEIVDSSILPVDHEPQNSEIGVRLFKRAPPGIVFDHLDELQRPKHRPCIIPGLDIDEKSKQFQMRIHAVAVDGKDVISQAKRAYQKSLARLEAKEAAAKREEERVKNLKNIRGERWLPSVAKEMKSDF